MTSRSLVGTAVAGAVLALLSGAAVAETDALWDGYRQAAGLIAAGARGRQADWPVLAPADLKAGLHHARHAEIFGKYAVGVNLQVLQGIDLVQSTAMDGGGYFAGVKAKPAESPIGYALRLFGAPLLAPPRKTSFCTGASYSAFIEALNLIYGAKPLQLSLDRAEAMRMQEPDGGRREDDVKFWGRWNADDMGAIYSLVQYAGMGKLVAPRDARAGDFMAVEWKGGKTHSVIFLGWYVSPKGERSMLVWSSQVSTNGLADYAVPLSRVVGVKFVRLTNPDALASFQVDGPAPVKVAWDKIDWPPAPKPTSVGTATPRRAPRSAS